MNKNKKSNKPKAVPIKNGMEGLFIMERHVENKIKKKEEHTNK